MYMVCLSCHDAKRDGATERLCGIGELPGTAECKGSCGGVLWWYKLLLLLTVVFCGHHQGLDLYKHFDRILTKKITLVVNNHPFDLKAVMLSRAQVHPSRTLSFQSSRKWYVELHCSVASPASSACVIIRSHIIVLSLPGIYDCECWCIAARARMCSKNLPTMG